jgi:short-subunit dehydrogenase
MGNPTTYRKAVITGASSGLGAAYADELAHRGCGVVLVARTTDRLQSLADRLQKQYGIEAVAVTADLTERAGQEKVEKLFADDPAIDLLVNNAGFGTLGAFGKLNLQREMDEVELNVIALVRLAHAAIGAMVPRGRGAILNIASLAAFQPAPFNATYGATKAYVKSFTESLAEELRGTGVKAQVCCPGFTRTEFQQRAGLDTTRIPAFLWMTAEDVVRRSLDALDKGTVVCVPGAQYWLASSLIRYSPEGLVRRIAGILSKRALVH